MTIDEAIKHCEEAAERQERASSFWSKESRHYKNCIECAKEHRQLATWLRELKAYRNKSQEHDDASCDEIWERAYAERDGKK